MEVLKRKESDHVETKLSCSQTNVSCELQISMGAISVEALKVFWHMFTIWETS